MFVSRIATILVGVVTQSCLAWWLGPADRGSYSVCLLYSMVLGVIFTLGLDAAAQYLISSRKLSFSQGVSTALTFCLIGAALAVAIGYVATHLPLSFFQKAPLSAFFLSLILVPFQMAGVFAYQILTALKDFTRLGILACIQSVLQLFATVIFVRFAKLGINGAMLATISVSALRTIFSAR